MTDPRNVEIELKINGETRQKSNTSKLIFDIPTMIADISKYQELREGDVIFTGTPEGVGQVHGGDVLVASIKNGGEDQDLVTLELRVEQ